MKINFIKEDPRVKAAHEEFIRQFPMLQSEEERERDKESTTGCFAIGIPLLICLCYSFLVWLFDWREGIMALIDLILFNAVYILLFLAGLYSLITQRKGRIIGSIVLSGYGTLVFIFMAPRFYDALSDLITGDSQVTEGTFRMRQGYRSGGVYHIEIDGRPHTKKRDRPKINHATHERLLEAHTIRMKQWKRSGVIQSVEITSKKPQPDI